MKLRNASENYIVPPVGRYKFKITASEATQAASSGAPMIKITGEIREPTEFAGAQFFDNMITDDGFKGAGFGKKKLRGLGINVDSEIEVPDAQIASHLLGLEGWVDVDHEQINDKGPSGEYDQPRWNMENGVRIAANKLVPKGYYTHNVQTQPQAGGQIATTGQMMPTGQAPQFQAPQGGFAPQGAPQFQAQPQWQGQPQQFQQAPQGFAGFPGAPTNGAPQAGAPLPWAQAPQPQVETGKRAKK